MKNTTLTKNMPNVKWSQLPPTKGPDSQGLQPNRFKTILSLKKKETK